MQPAAPAPCRAGGCGPGNGKIAANEKRGRRRAPSHSGICAAWPRQLAARRVWRKTKHWQPAFLAFWDGKAPCLAAPVPCRAGSYEPGNDKNGRKRKARAQEGPCPTAECARLGRGSLPPAEPEKNRPSAARAPGFWGWESALFGCAGARRAGGYGQEIAPSKKPGRRRGPVPQRDVRGLGAAACRPNSCQ